MIRLATRGSTLALWQADAVARALLRARPGEEIRIVTVRTHGDEVQDRALAALGSTNVFTAEIDRAVAEARADAGVHSLKDLGTQMAGGIQIGATLPRGPVEDVLIASRAGSLAALPAGASVGTGSPRRQAMLLAERPDLRCVDLRGNVETRLAKVARGAVDAVILARAGIERLGRSDAITEVLPMARFLPAACQGIVGITCRSGDARIEGALREIRDAHAFGAALAERAVLRELRAGCHAAVGVLATVESGRMTVRGRVLSRDGATGIAAEIAGVSSDAEVLGTRLAQELLAQGAATLLG